VSDAFGVHVDYSTEQLLEVEPASCLIQLATQLDEVKQLSTRNILKHKVIDNSIWLSLALQDPLERAVEFDDAWVVFKLLKSLNL
jgi:hypothetical protein